MVGVALGMLLMHSGRGYFVHAIAAMVPRLTPMEEAQLEVLRALHAGGRDVLHRKATEAGVSETEFLYRLAGLPPPRPVRPPPPGGAGAYAPY